MQSFLAFIFVASIHLNHIIIDVANGDHAIYLSVVEMSHKMGEDNATIKIKVFSNDMEDAIMNTFNLRINMEDPSTCDGNREQIKEYFLRHFQCSINGKKVSPLLSHCESNGDTIWFHFQINCPGQWDEVSVKADYLMELFPTQSNVVSILHGDEKRFIKLTKSNPAEVVRF